MIDDRPPPMTPADSDLRTLAYMPLMVDQLRKSKAWLFAKRNPELGFYMINIWTAAWHNLPAGSLEDDDDVLADQAMCPSVIKWLQVREQVLRGWAVCSDNRLYHPVVAARVTDALDRRQGYRDRLSAAREAKAQKLLQANQRTLPEGKQAKDMAVADMQQAIPQAGETPNIGQSQDLSHINGTSIIEPSQINDTPNTGLCSVLIEGEGELKKESKKEPPLAPPKGEPEKKPQVRRRQRTPTSPIPADWQPDEAGITYAASQGASCDLNAVDAFRNYHKAHGSIMADWKAAWRTWCGNARQYGRGIKPQKDQTFIGFAR